MILDNNIVYNKTMDKKDLSGPSTSSMKRELSSFGRKLFIKGIPFASNGFLKRRFYVRWYKMWEYARSLAYLDIEPGQRVLDFGGGATLPVFYLAQKGCEVISADIDEGLTGHANTVARSMKWNLKGSPLNICRVPVPSEWGKFEYIISFCTIEHLSTEDQRSVLGKMAGSLADNGVLAITFDYGEEAPTENPIRTPSDVMKLIEYSGLELIGNPDFIDNGERFRLKNRKKYYSYTFGSLFLRKK